MQVAPAQEFSISTGSVERPATAYIFYPLNMIAPAIKASVVDWKAGGLLRPELATLRHKNGYIRQCEITECRQHMVAQAARNVYPTERRHMHRQYVLNENGESRVISGGSSDDPLLFTPWYPDQELPSVLGANDGLVRMPIENAAEMRMAQYFLFPDWDDYLSGKKQLPTKLAQIRELLAARQQAATNAREVGYAEAALRACDLAESYGRQHVSRENAIYAEAQAKGWAWNYGVEAELYMEQLGIQRRDNLAQEQASKIDRLADVLADAFSRQGMIPAVPVSAVQAEAQPEQPKVEEREAVPQAAQAAIEVGSIVRVDGKVGQVVAINKKEATIEAPDGGVFKAPVGKLEVG